MKKLIITADDYGMSPAVNEGIEAGINAGVITATNLMVGMEYCDGVIALKKKHPEISIGLHWTLSAGYPVSKKEMIPSLLDRNGMFWSYQEFRKRFKRKAISLVEIKKELLAQYERYIDFCGEPDYWNTHQNVHVDFGIFEIFLSTALELKILKMRSHQRIYVPARGKSSFSTQRRIIEPVKRIILNKWLANANKMGIHAPDGLITPLNEEDKNDLEYVFSSVEWGNKTVGEIIIHPATANDSVYFGKITDKRIKESQLFSDRQVGNLIKQNGIELCGFGVVQ